MIKIIITYNPIVVILYIEKRTLILLCLFFAIIKREEQNSPLFSIHSNDTV